MLTLISGIGLTTSVSVAAILVSQQPRPAEDDPRFLVLGLGMFGSLILAGVGGLLGILGLLQKDCRRTAALWGCVLAGLQIGGLAALLVISLLSG